MTEPAPEYLLPQKSYVKLLSSQKSSQPRKITLADLIQSKDFTHLMTEQEIEFIYHSPPKKYRR